MSILEEITNKVGEIADLRGLTPDKAFGFWFLEDIEELSEEEAESTITDGPWDGGRDAVYFDEENLTTNIYQFKYSEDLAYVSKGLTDLQNGVQNEVVNLKQSKSLRLYIVTVATMNDAVHGQSKMVLKLVRTWLTKQGYDIETDLELIDLKKFAQMFEKIFGLDLTVSFRGSPTKVDDGLYGIMDATAFKGVVERDELFAFNIRKFLGMRKGSVNYQIQQTLEDSERRPHFWHFNNGIVCLCTSLEETGLAKYRFENFTIVNGAQTISTIARFLESNPTFVDPLWVLAKVLKVGPEEIEKARMLTMTSNSQTPTSNRDIRAVDSTHRILKRWFKDHMGAIYLYRRGETAPKGAAVVPMKELAQAFVAYVREEPHISFARAGKIFRDEEYYDSVFPGAEIHRANQAGSAAEIRQFLVQRLLPYSLLIDIKKFLEKRVEAGEDKKWKSLSYHILWIYRQIFDKQKLGNVEVLLQEHSKISASATELIFDALKDFAGTLDHEIPRDLKTTRVAEDLKGKGYLDALSSFKKARQKVTRAFKKH